MPCTRCSAEAPLARSGWCAPCEQAYDGWSRRYASDILYALLGGGCVVASVAILVPLLGIPWIVSVSGIFAGFATIAGIHRSTQRRRRRQFLSGGAVPRAYLPSKT